jgi:exonuclease SbcC
MSPFAEHARIAQAAISGLEEKIAALKAAAEQRNELEAAQLHLKEAKSAHETAGMRSAELSEKIHLAEKKLRAFEQQLALAPAVALARGLSAGNPCPVCGSNEHPSPAQHSPGVPVLADIEALRAEYYSLREEKTDLLLDAARLSESIRSEINAIAKLSEAVSMHDGKSKEEIAVAIVTAEMELETNRKIAGYKDACAEDKKSAEAEIEYHIREKENLAVLIREADAKLASMERALRARDKIT